YGRIGTFTERDRLRELPFGNPVINRRLAQPNNVLDGVQPQKTNKSVRHSWSLAKCRTISAQTGGPQIIRLLRLSFPKRAGLLPNARGKPDQWKKRATLGISMCSGRRTISCGF